MNHPNHDTNVPIVSASPLARLSEAALADVYLTSVHAAALLGLRASTLAAWRCLKSDGPPFVKIGSAVRYRRSALLAWAEARTHESTGSFSLSKEKGHG